MKNATYITATDDVQETIDLLKRMISDSKYYSMYAQLSIATYYKTINLDADALRVLIAHYELQRINDTRPAWMEPETVDKPTPTRRLVEDRPE